jgi:hypothetical protein
MQLTQADNLVIQSHITTSLLAELKNNSFLASDFFEQMSFGIPWFKEQLREIGVDNQGCALMSLYAMLVIPREIVQSAFSSEYHAINDFLRTCVINENSSYKQDIPNINFIRHLRNSIAHARIAFRPNDAIIFTDEDSRRNERFTADLPLKHLGELINRLQTVHVAYIQQIHSRT